MAQEGENYYIIKNIQDRWVWYNQSCWMDTFFVNLLAAKESPILDIILKYQGNDDLHYFILKLFYLSRSANYPKKEVKDKNVKCYTIDDEFRKFLGAKNEEWFGNERGNPFSAGQTHSVGRIQYLIFRMYGIEFEYSDLNQNIRNVNKAISCLSDIRGKKITFKDYIENHLKLYKDYDFLVFDCSIYNSFNDIPECFQWGDDNFFLYSAGIHTGDKENQNAVGHYTSLVYDGLVYHHVNIIGDNPVENTSTSSFLEAGRKLPRNATPTFLFYYKLKK